MIAANIPEKVRYYIVGYSYKTRDDDPNLSRRFPGHEQRVEKYRRRVEQGKPVFARKRKDPHE